MNTWHESAERREQLGKELERRFTKTVRCACGGDFKYIGDMKPGIPDFTCEDCGQLVDVKYSPQAESTGNLSVSAIPWQHYPEDLLLVTRIRGKWLGEFKRYIEPEPGVPRQPTHHLINRRLGNTQWRLISWRRFRPIAEVGLIEQ